MSSKGKNMDAGLRRLMAKAASLAMARAASLAMAGAASLAMAGVLLAGMGPLLANDSAASQQKSIKGTGSASNKVSVELPVSTALFPARAGADIANSQCLICHSADMVLYQPARTQDQWKETINKMRAVYGAPITADQIDALAAYLSELH